MKNMKRLISTLLMLSMMTALLCVPAFAAVDPANFSVSVSAPTEVMAGENFSLTATLSKTGGDVGVEGHNVFWYMNDSTTAFTQGANTGSNGSSTLNGATIPETTTFYAEVKIGTEYVRSAPIRVVAKPIPTTPTVNIVEPQLTLDQGSDATLTVAVGNDPDSVGVTWSSSDTSVATVTQSGYVIAVAPGTATITAAYANNLAIYDTCNVYVSGKAVTITPIVSELSKGQTINIEATVEGANFSHWFIDGPSGCVSIANTTYPRTTLTALAASGSPITLYAYADNGKYNDITFTVTAAEPLQIEAYPANIDNTESTSVYVVNPIPGEEFTWTVVPSAQYGVLSYNSAYSTGSSINLTAGPVEGRVDITATSRSDSSRSDTVTVYVNTEAAYGNAKITPAVATWQRGQAALKFGVSPAYYYAWLDGKALTPESKSYTYYNGVLTLSTGLLSTLSSGEHTLKVQTASNNGQDGLVYATIYVTGSASNVYGDNAHVRGSAYNLYFNSTDPIKEVYISNQWIDPANYVLTNNGTGLTLKSDFLNKLGYGTYSMRLVTQNGYNQNASFRIVTANYAPATGDDANLGAWMVLLTLSLAGAIALVPKRKQSKDLIG